MPAIFDANWFGRVSRNPRLQSPEKMPQRVREQQRIEDADELVWEVQIGGECQPRVGHDVAEGAPAL
jgi:hypothetical protein